MFRLMETVEILGEVEIEPEVGVLSEVQELLEPTEDIASVVMVDIELVVDSTG